MNPEVQKKISWLKKMERMFISRWLAFGERYRDSLWLPAGFFLSILSDGILLFVPSVLLFLIAVSLNPRRAWLFSFLFALGTALNNSLTYLIGRSLPAATVLHLIHRLHADGLMDTARTALTKYGAYGTLVGAIFAMPTQLMTAILGMNDAQRKLLDSDASSMFLKAIFFVFLGKLIKASVLSILFKFGLIKLTEKLGLYASAETIKSGPDDSAGANQSR